MDDSETAVTPPAAQLTTVTPADLTSRYEILALVGRGGQGAVYKARHIELNKLMAVKVCLPGRSTDRFEREAQLAARVRSPHVVAVHDFTRLPDGELMLAMDWVDGTTLATVIKTSGAVAESRAVEWMRQVCRGMQAATEEGVIHRDLKPSNILLDGRDVALIADFGLARAPDVEELTLQGSTLGTPLYMAPEQADDPRHADTRSDIYSFGATFYHALTGEPPFRGQSDFSVMFKHKTEPLVAPRARNPNLTPRSGACLERCLAKSPTDRFQSFKDVLAFLESSEADPWETRDDPEAEHQMRAYRARRAVYLNPRQAFEPADVYPFPHGRSLWVGCGNLEEQHVHALVSSDDERLTMGGGVSAALCHAAGPGYYEDAQRFVPVRHGRAVVTGAGALPARFVFHAITLAWVGTGQRPTRDLINELLDSCFYHADTLGVKSIALPLLATGVGMLAPDECLDTMFRYLAKKLARSATSVREARIVLFRRAAL